MKEKTERLTQALGEQTTHKLIMVPHVEDTIDTGGHQLFLGVTQVTAHILRHKDNTTLSIHHKKEAIQGLEEKWREGHTAPQQEVSETHLEETLTQDHSAPNSMEQGYEHQQTIAHL